MRVYASSESVYGPKVEVVEDPFTSKMVALNVEGMAHVQPNTIYATYTDEWTQDWAVYSESDSGAVLNLNQAKAIHEALGAWIDEQVSG